MTKQRRSFSQEFKLDSAKLVLDEGYSFPEAARSLEVGETALRRWVKQLQDERGGITPNSKALTPEQLKIIVTRTRNSKHATDYFYRLMRT